MDKNVRTAIGRKRGGAALTAMLVFAVTLPVQAQMIVAANPDADYQKLPYAKVKHVLLYDYTCGSHNKAHILNSLTRLANKYGFRLDRGQTNSYITPFTLHGVDVAVLSNGDCDVLTNPIALSAMRNFVEVEGKGILYTHAAAAYIPCPDENNLTDPNCRWQMKTLKTQFYQHPPDPTLARIYADSVKKGDFTPRATEANTLPAAENHGRSNPETRMIFDSKLFPLPVNGGNGATAGQKYVWDGLGDSWYNYRNNPRLQGAQIIDGVLFGPLNILLSLDETTITSSSCCRMGDRPASWTRKVGNGNAAYQNAGHSDVYTRARQVGGVGGAAVVSVKDSLIEKYNWNLIRYLARDFVGCMDDRYAEYNPEASVTVLNPALDEPEPCKTPTAANALTRNSTRAVSAISAGSAIRISLTDAVSHHILIVDINGKSVYTGSAMGPKRLDIPDLQNGSYVVKISTSAGDQVRKVEVSPER